MYKLVAILVLFSAVMFSCKKEVIVLENNSESTEIIQTKSPLSNETNGVGSGSGNAGDDSDVITDPNNDADEDKRKKGK